MEDYATKQLHSKSSNVLEDVKKKDQTDNKTKETEQIDETEQWVYLPVINKTKTDRKKITTQNNKNVDLPVRFEFLVSFRLTIYFVSIWNESFDVF